MIEAANLADEVAYRLRHRDRQTILDPCERVHSDHALARMADRVASMIRDELAQESRPVLAKTRPCERRRTIRCRKGREVVVESRLEGP